MNGGVVYLLHFVEPYPAGKRPQHYMGHAEEGRFETRLGEHRRGTSKARFTQVLAEAGIQFVVARTWQGDYELEKTLKRRHRPRALCPLCRYRTTLLEDRTRTNCSVCGRAGEWYEFEPGSGRCVSCQS